MTVWIDIFYRSVGSGVVRTDNGRVDCHVSYKFGSGDGKKLNKKLETKLVLLMEEVTK